MAEERTDEEQIEALKLWWAENGMKTIAAIVLVVGGYFGSKLAINLDQKMLKKIKSL